MNYPLFVLIVRNCSRSDSAASMMQEEGMLTQMTTVTAEMLFSVRVSSVKISTEIDMYLVITPVSVVEISTNAEEPVAYELTNSPSD